jgi:hypothetical protein
MRSRRHSIGSSRSTPLLAELETPKEAPVQEDVQGAEPNMIVAVRVRPLSSEEKSKGLKSCCTVLNGKVVAIKKEGDPSGYLRSQMASINDYGFDAAFDENSTQTEVYEKTAKGFIKNVIKGLNVTVFAYGATGAGKTHTMLGNTRADESAAAAEAGVIPQAVFDLFAQLDAKKPTLLLGEKYNVITSFVEIYNEQVYDLLEPSGRILQLREDQERGVVQCAGCTDVIVESAKDVMLLLAQGNKRRKTEATMANSVSSRSHAVLQLSLQHVKRTDAGREVITDSKLSLIDLAGSERASATNNRGARLQEGANINRSLLALANCINALASNSSNNGRKTNVKYRDSRLTHLLKASLEGGNCNLVMIANVNPAHTTFEDSHNTLKYANRAKNIKVNPQAQEQAVESTWLERENNLREENIALKERILELESTVQRLLRGGSAPPPVDEPLSDVMDTYDTFSAPMEDLKHIEGVNEEDVEDNHDDLLNEQSVMDMVAADMDEDAASSTDNIVHDRDANAAVELEHVMISINTEDSSDSMVLEDEVIEEPDTGAPMAIYTVDICDTEEDACEEEVETITLPAPALEATQVALKSMVSAQSTESISMKSNTSKSTTTTSVANPFLQVLSSATKLDRNTKRNADEASITTVQTSSNNNSNAGNTGVVLENKRRRTMSSNSNAASSSTVASQPPVKAKSVFNTTSAACATNNKVQPVSTNTAASTTVGRKIRRRSLRTLPEDAQPQAVAQEKPLQTASDTIMQTKKKPTTLAPAAKSIQNQENENPQIKPDDLPNMDSKLKPIFRAPIDNAKGRRRSLGGVEGSLAAVSAMLVDLGATTGLVTRNKIPLTTQRDTTTAGLSTATRKKPVAVVPVEGSDKVWIDI